MPPVMGEETVNRCVSSAMSAPVPDREQRGMTNSWPSVIHPTKLGVQSNARNGRNGIFPGGRVEVRGARRHVNCLLGASSVVLRLVPPRPAPGTNRDSST